MIERILPAAEWPRLAHTDIHAMLPFLNPADIDIVVIEDGADIVACWAVVRVVHLEGVWIHPAYRHKGSVARRLIRATWNVAKRLAPRWVMTAAREDDSITKRLLVKHLGAVQVPMTPYLVGLDGMERICQQRY